MPKVGETHRVDAGVTPFGRISFGTASVVCALVLAAAAPAAVAAPGDIYVADRDAGPGGTGAVIRVDPATGAQQVVASGGGLEDPTGIAVDLFAFPGHDTLLVADPAALGGAGAMFRVDPSTGVTQVVSSGDRFVDPTGVTGQYAVADANAIPSASGFGNGDIFFVDPDEGGAQRSFLDRAVPVDTQLVDPSGIAPTLAGPSHIANLLYIADPEAAGGGGAVFGLGPPFGNVFQGPFFTVSTGGDLADPTSLADVPSGVTGQRFVAVADESAAGGSGALLSLVGQAPQVTQQVISSGGSFADPSAVAYTPFAGGPLLVADRSAAGGGGVLFSVDPATGAQSAVSSGGSFVEPAGVAVVPPPCRGFSVDFAGSEQADEIVGSSGSEAIAALGGDDAIGAAEGGDLVCGGEGDDELLGDQPETDFRLIGRDILVGEGGSDELDGGLADDKLLGGPGGDKVRAKGGGKDRVNCGGGRDRARVDGKDRVRGCERVKR
jgi:hypothetical protein